MKIGNNKKKNKNKSDSSWIAIRHGREKKSPPEWGRFMWRHRRERKKSRRLLHTVSFVPLKKMEGCDERMQIKVDCYNILEMFQQLGR